MIRDYAIFISLVLVGCCGALAAAYFMHKKSIAFRMTPVGVGCAATVAIAGFVIGKQGFTPLAIGIAAACVLPPLLITYYYLIRNFIRPIQELNTAINAVAEGNLGAQEPKIQSGDELGQMAAAHGSVVTKLREVTAVAEKISEGNLAIDWQVHSDQDLIGKALNKMMNSMRARVADILSSADRMSAETGAIEAGASAVDQVSDQIAVTIQQIAQGATQQAGGIQRTAASVEQMNNVMSRLSGSARQEIEAVRQATQVGEQLQTVAATVNEHAQSSAQGSLHAAKTARDGAVTIQASMQSLQNIRQSAVKVNDKVQLMGSRSEQIGAIVQTIEEIAGQTNLLALNAAIESARAGEAGRGFAVVADEVRKLAEKSATATKEIAELVRGIQETVNEAVTAIGAETSEIENGVARSDEAAKALSQILTAVESINSQVGGIAGAAQEMRSASVQLSKEMDAVLSASEQSQAAVEEMMGYTDEVGQAMEVIASVSEENSASVEELSAVADNMRQQAADVGAATQSLREYAVNLQQKTMQLSVKKVSGKTARGAALLGRVDFVKERYGQAAWERVLRRLDPQVRQIFIKGVDAQSEYPPETLGALTAAIKNELAGGSDVILREMTAFRAKFDVLPGGALAQHFRMGDPGYTIRRMDLCLRHNWGDGVIVRNKEVGPNHIIQEVDMGRKQPRERCTYNHVGWMEGVIIAAGGIPHITKTACMHDGARCCVYDISWELADKKTPARQPALQMK